MSQKISCWVFVFLNIPKIEAGCPSCAPRLSALTWGSNSSFEANRHVCHSERSDRRERSRGTPLPAPPIHSPASECKRPPVGDPSMLQPSRLRVNPALPYGKRNPVNGQHVRRDAVVDVMGLGVTNHGFK